VSDSNTQTQRFLEAELDEIAKRLHSGAGDVTTAPAGGDFFDLAQDLEHQELARLSASRLSERARRLRIARLRALPDTTTCVGYQNRLERSARHTS